MKIMQLEKRTSIDEHGNMLFDMKAMGGFTFRFPYLLEARQAVQYLESLILAQMQEDALQDAADELYSLKN